MQTRNTPFNQPQECYCQFCNKLCKSKNSLVNHERHCKHNPNKVKSNIELLNELKLTPWNKGLTAQTDERLKNKISKQKENYKLHPEHYHYGSPHSPESKNKLRELALKRGLGGFHMRRGIYYNNIKLDSSYEVAVAQTLDENNVKWERCNRFKYVWEDGSTHYYTPDFYLPEYKLYLDPKNDFLINEVNPGLGINDVDKINLVSAQNDIRIIVLDKDHLTWEAIKLLIYST